MQKHKISGEGHPLGGQTWNCTAGRALRRHLAQPHLLIDPWQQRHTEGKALA